MIEKILERLEAERKTAYRTYETFEQKVDLGRAFGVERAIEIVQEVAKEYGTSYMEQLVEAKMNCSEDSDCSECPFGKIEDRCILAELRSDAKDGGWIPCSSGQKPMECEEVNVTIKDDEGNLWTTTSWLQDGVWVVKKTALHPRVIAWKPLDAPYQKGEKHE